MAPASKAFLTLGAALLAGCEALQFYTGQIQGISPAKLVPLYFQEKQYVEDRRLVAAVRGALAAEPGLRVADIDVDAYLKEVTLAPVSASEEALARALEVAHRVPGVKSVSARAP